MSKQREFQLDAERRNNAVDGLDTRERVSFDPLGYLFRIDDALLAGDGFTDESNSDSELDNLGPAHV